MLLNKLTTLTAIAAVCLIVSPVAGQNGETSIVDAASTAMLTANGNLSGNVQSATSQVPQAKVSLVSQGKVIDSVTTDEAGNFSFANVNPGPYQIVGSAEGMVGSSALNVAPFAQAAGAAPATVMLQGASADAMYDTYSSTPVSSFSNNPVANYNTSSCGCSSCSSAASSCSTCSGGGIGSRLGLGGGNFGGGLGGGNFGGGLGGGNFGGGLGSRLGGGLLTSPRGLLLIGGLAGGLSAIEDSSPDQ